MLFRSAKGSVMPAAAGADGAGASGVSAPTSASVAAPTSASASIATPAKDPGGLILTVALVWFSTHVGGGFASGASHYSYFINYGFWSLILAPLSLAAIAFVYWWGWRHAAIAKTYDYRTFNDSFYGKYAPVMSNLYEVLIVFVVIIGCGVAFATGSSLIAELTGMPYLAASAIIGAIIFVVCIFGTNVVRRASAVLSALMIGALLLIYVPAIATHAPELASTLADMRAQASTAGFAGFAAALGGAAMYAVYQASDVAIYVQHVRPLHDSRSVGKALFISYFINLAFFALTLFGLLTVSGTPELAATSVPLLAVIDGLPGAPALKIAATALISVACISTAVTFISGMVKRLCVRFEGRNVTEAAEDRNRPTRLGIVFALVLTLFCFGVAQFGLLPLVQKGYSLLAYMAIPVVTIPYIVNFIWTKVRRKGDAR